MWKIHSVNTIFLLDIFQTDGEIIFNHTYDHAGIFCALTFNVIAFFTDNEIRICNTFTVFCLMFVSKLDDWSIHRIIRRKDFIDQWNDQLRHFFQHCTKNIIKNSIVICHEAFPFWLLCIVIIRTQEKILVVYFNSQVQYTWENLSFVENKVMHRSSFLYVVFKIMIA